MHTKKKRKINYYFLVFVVSFRVQKNLEPHPNWSPLGGRLIQNFQQACFMWESPPSPGSSVNKRLPGMHLNFMKTISICILP